MVFFEPLCYVKMKKKIVIAAVTVVALGGILLIPVGGQEADEHQIKPTKVKVVNLQNYSTESPGRSLNLFFIHHSCGGQMLAPMGSDDGDHCIYKSHSNGGGLRPLLEEQGYLVHEASYGSELGEETDIFDWPRKFKEKMDKILTAAGQNKYYSDGTKNDIVAFKSCFPNNRFVGEGSSPGNPNGPTLTVANAKAAYSEILVEMGKHPETLFVAVTAPPVVATISAEPIWKQLARVVLGKQQVPPSKSGPLARKFNNWLKSEDGWLKGYPNKNVVVFDYYDILTGKGESNFLKYPSGANRDDSHPNTVGNSKAAEAFVPFINSAVRRAGLLDK